MQEIEQMVAAAMERIETVLDSKSVVGESVTVGEYTIIPLVSIGFGFGSGTATGKSEDVIKGEGAGAGLAGGGGIKPVAVVVIGPEGIKVEFLKGASASLLESLASSAKSGIKSKAE